MDREEFIEKQAAFQFGECHAAPDVSLTGLAGRGSSLAIYHDPSDQRLLPERHAAGLSRGADGRWTYGPPGTNPKGRINAQLLNDLHAYGVRHPFLANMENAVRRPQPDFPQFQYHRYIGSKNTIIWPLERVHGIGRRSFCALPSESEPSFKDKKPVVFWRGSMVGMSTYGGKVTNIQRVIRQCVEGEIEKELLLAHLGTLSRWNFVSRYHGRDGFDVGFHQSERRNYYNEVPELARLNKPSVTPAEQTHCKYVVTLQGNDVGSSFGWQIGTYCVILKETYPWEVFFDCHFRPWEHFVPISPDLSDVEERLSWCEANPDACEEMSQKRHELVGLLLDQEVRDEALGRVVERYNAFYEAWREAR